MAVPFVSHSEKQTWQLAQKIIGKYSPDIKETGLVLALEGNLGAGKTTFTQGLGEILGVPRPIRSPGYILVSEYLFNLNAKEGKLFHADLWRTESEEEVRRLKLEELIEPGNILVIEWAQKVPKLIKDIGRQKEAPCIRIAFEHQGENAREISYEKL